MRTRFQAAALTIGAFVACVAYLAMAWMTVFDVRIGPVVATLDEAAGHGVHAGDLLALPMVALAAAMFVLGVTMCERAVRPRSRTPWRLAA